MKTLAKKRNFIMSDIMSKKTKRVMWSFVGENYKCDIIVPEMFIQITAIPDTSDCIEISITKSSKNSCETLKNSMRFVKNGTLFLWNDDSSKFTNIITEKWDCDGLSLKEYDITLSNPLYKVMSVPISYTLKCRFTYYDVYHYINS